jgi:hypothetical protein
VSGPPPRQGIEPRYEEKAGASAKRGLLSGHHPTAVTSNEASMTSRRVQPSDMPVSLAGGAPRRNRTDDPIPLMGRRANSTLARVFATRGHTGIRWRAEAID